MTNLLQCNAEFPQEDEFFFKSNSSVRKSSKSGVTCVQSLAWSSGGTKAMYPEVSLRPTLVNNLNSMESTASTVHRVSPWAKTQNMVDWYHLAGQVSSLRRRCIMVESLIWLIPRDFIGGFSFDERHVMGIMFGLGKG